MLLVIPAESATPGSPLEPWVTVTALADLTPDVPQPRLEVCAQTATEVLWALSGRQFPGLRRRGVRVLAPACPCDGRRWSSPGADGFLPRDLARFGPGWGWGCGCVVELQLPDEDARQVLSVTIDGTVLDPAGYRLDWGGRLVRVDGAAWPMPATAAAPSLEVIYVYGTQPPAGGVAAALALAAAYAREQQTGCKLPQRVTQITADGVSIALDDLKTLREGGTGVAMVDIWLHSVNPNRQQQRPRILSPSSPRFRTSVPSF